MNKNVNIEVSTPPWAETDKSYRLLVNKAGAGWSHGFWFPKSVCNLDIEKGVLNVPNWLLKKHAIEEMVTYVD